MAISHLLQIFNFNPSRNILILLCIVSIQLSLNSQNLSSISLPFITNYTTDIYNGGIQNWGIGEALDGRLYVANNLGLLEFDAKNWEVHNLRYGTKVRSLYFDQDRIYTGSQNDFGYLSPNSEGTLIYSSLADSLPITDRNFDETWKIYGDKDLIYFCTFSNIYTFDGVNLNTISSEHSLEISFWLEHQLITQEWGLGLSKLVDEHFELIPNGQFFKDKRVSSIIPNGKKKWLISTFNDGLFTYNNGSIKPYSLIGLPNNLTLNGILRLSTGDLAIATQNSGLFIVSSDERDVKNINMQKGLLDNTINEMFEDKQGNLWLSLNNGISRIDINSPLSIIDDRIGVSGAGYASLQTDDGYYLGTNNGLYKINSDQVQKLQGSEGQVYSIQEINETVLIGHHEGPMTINKNKTVKLNDEKGAWYFEPLPDNTGRLLTGTYLGLNLIDTKNELTYKKLDGFEESSRVMVFDNETLWVTHGYKGAFKIQFTDSFTKINSVDLYNSNKGFPTDQLINVYEISGELVFTSESGFFRYNEKNDQFEPYDVFNNSIGGQSAIVDIDEDVLGNIYYIDADHIDRIEPDGQASYKRSFNSFGKVGKLWNDDLGNITVLDSDEILIGARKGFILYEPKKERNLASEFHAHFSQISLLNEQNDLMYGGHGSSDKILNTNFKYANNSIAFQYFAPHFESGQNLVFQFQLENYDLEWSDWSTTDFKEYTNLKEGEYTFKVRAKNIYGQISDEAAYSFEISPPIYRTTAAYLIYGSGTFFLVFLGFKTLDHKHKKETKELEKTKNQALDQKDQEIQNITEQSEQEIGELRSAKLEAELRLKSQALTSSAMNLIQKNELLNQVKKTLAAMDKSEWKAENKTQVNRMVKSIDKDLASGEEWSQFEENFDQVHGNFITRLKEAYPKLTPQEIKFSAYLRMNLNSKEIANLLNISVRGVEIGRYRVRKKLELERKDNLADFLMRF